MKAHQIFAALSPALQQEIMSYLNRETRQAFQTALFQVGAVRKLRPQYFQSKKGPEREQWLATWLKAKIFDGVTEQMLQLWLLKAKEGMIVSFLDAAGIKHDGKGQVDDLPEQLTDKQVEHGVAAMLKEHPADHVALYLRIFQLQRPGGWDAVAAVLERNAEIKAALPAA